jgi:hypothetical protein
LSITINILLPLEVTAAEVLNTKSEVFNRTVLLTKLILQTRADDSPRILLEKYAAYAATICLAEFVAHDQNSKTDFVKTATIKNYDREYPGPYSSYSSLCLAVTRRFLAQPHDFRYYIGPTLVSTRNGSVSARNGSVTARHNDLYGIYGRLWLWATVAYGTQHLFSSYSLLGLAVTWPLMAKTAVQNTNLGII